MENPATELKNVIRTLIQGTPEEQEDALYHYFAPGASFEHPFCRVPSFKNIHVPGLGNVDSRILISAIYKWYKILSPRIKIQIESCVFDENTNLAFVKIFQVFSIWFIPFYHAPVDLVTVLHLEKRTPPSNNRDHGTPPPPPPSPPYDAAQEKRQAVQEGAEPSYASVAAVEASASTSGTQEQGQQAKEEEAPKRWYIAKQQDLYQVNEFVKFVSLGPGAAMAGFFQLFATLLCLMGAVLLGPFLNAAWPARNLKGEKEKKKQKKST